MTQSLSRKELEQLFRQSAREAMNNQTLEEIAEATPQATQRGITLASLALVRAQRDDFHLFNELLVQYLLPRHKKPKKVVPDNMVVLHAGPLEVVGSYDIELQPVRPFWALEYVSQESERKDYHDNMVRYEKHIQIPYYLIFSPDAEEVTLYHLIDGKYVAVPPNAQGRIPLKELELEIAILDGWVRYWFRGELLPLPADLQREVQDLRRQLLEQRRRTERERKRAAAEAKRANEAERRNIALEQELARLRAQLSQQPPPQP